MNLKHHLIFQKISQFLWAFILVLSFTSSLQATERRKNFICGYLPIVEYVNSHISLERKNTLSYFRKLKENSKISKEEGIEFLATLMRYRLFPIHEEKEEWQKCRFFSYLCMNQENKTTYDYASDYLTANDMAMPDFCWISSGKSYVKKSLFEKECLAAIYNRVDTIPAPLAITQAGIETGWGQSRFSQEGHNYYGMQARFSSAQKVSSKSEECLSPKGNRALCVFKFGSIETNFFIYSQLLNSFENFISVRNNRYRAERSGKTTCETSLEMAKKLKNYAEDPNYIRKVQNTIPTVCEIMSGC